MTLIELIQQVPQTVKLLGSWATGVLTFFVSYRAYRGRQHNTKKQLIKEYKEMYIKQSMELIRLTKSESEKHLILIKMQSFCPDCYQKVIKELGYED